MELPVPELPEEHLLHLTPLQTQVLEHIKFTAINARLNISLSDFNRANDLMEQDIYFRAKLELLEDLLTYDVNRMEQLQQTKTQPQR